MKSAFFQRLYDAVMNPPADEVPVEAALMTLPTLWLLGKTGAGKSTFIKTLTNDSKIEIGNGFQPCTQTASLYTFPNEKPLVAFLDSRGLDEVDYDPTDDIAYCQSKSHAVVIACALDEPDQASVIAAYKQALMSQRDLATVLVFSRKHKMPAEDAERAQTILQQQFEAIAGKALPAVIYNSDDDVEVARLKATVAEILPTLHLWLQSSQAKDAESLCFQRYQNEILWYAGAAAASDTLPGVGLVTVPTIQGKLLHSLGKRYDYQWDRARLSAFSSALGASMLLRYGGQLGGRQLAKLIPGIGQTVGSAAAAVISFSTTYALGRVACYYLYQSKLDLPVDADSLQVIYRQALSEAKSMREKNNAGDKQ
ncbi:YcjF family protein [Thaumasiovibrio subtropicus]|uniref:YcjF family protein n=1 Tax=Thaumasiovibrio subtropicus TaxID=1891207 RepID=UPI00131AB86A|nr:GTPase [Thaumasiovibrio subtropicus]